MGEARRPRQRHGLRVGLRVGVRAGRGTCAAAATSHWCVRSSRHLLKSFTRAASMPCSKRKCRTTRSMNFGYYVLGIPTSYVQHNQPSRLYGSWYSLQTVVGTQVLTDSDTAVTCVPCLYSKV